MMFTSCKHDNGNGNSLVITSDTHSCSEVMKPGSLQDLAPQ